MIWIWLHQNILLYFIQITIIFFIGLDPRYISPENNNNFELVN